MRKLISILCVIAMVLSFAACGASASKPESTVTSFCEGLKTFDFTKMQSCVDVSFTEDDALSTSEDMPESFYNSMKDYAKSITYTVGTATIDGETAMVPVNFKYKDASAVITTALGNYLTKAFALAFSGGDSSDEAMTDLLVSCYNEALTSAEVKDAEASVTFNLKKIDSSWKISSVPEETLYVLSSNILKAFAEWGDSFDEDTASGEPEYIGDPSFTWHDVKMGESVELSKFKITLTGCSETKELKGDFGSQKADDGTKFVVFTYTIENITKQGEYFSSDDLMLYDSQDREFGGYEDAFWYNDDVLVYEELDPNMPKKTASIYNVPDNADGYYMVVGKEGTKDYYKLYGK